MFKKSHNFTVQSPDVVTRCVPYGWNATSDIQSLCPSPDIINSPLGNDHTFQVISSEQVAKNGFLL